MDHMNLPPPIVIAPIDDEEELLSLDPRIPNSQQPASQFNIGSSKNGFPAADNTTPLRALAQHNQNLFGHQSRSGFSPHNFPVASASSRTTPHSSGHFVPPHGAGTRPSQFAFQPEQNNNSSFSPNTSGLPKYPSHEHIWPTATSSSYLQNKRYGPSSWNKMPVPPPHMLPRYNDQALQGMPPMRLDQLSSYGNSVFPPHFPPTVFDQYNLPVNNNVERPMFPFSNTLPHTQGSDRPEIGMQQISPPSRGQVEMSRPVDVSFDIVDGKRIPCIKRGNELYTSVRTVEVKLLSKFPNSYPEEVKKKPPIKSSKMRREEADAFNRLNKEGLFEYGMESFEEDLLVRLCDFKDFYNIIKKHFPVSLSPEQLPGGYMSGNTSPQSAVPGCNPGGWLQMNNTIVPYIKRGDNKYLPVCIVKYAAGLPISDGPFSEFLTSEECKFLNEQCKSAGLSFSFHTMTVIGSLEKIMQYSNSALIIKYLPVNNPFDSATYDPSLEPSRDKPPVSASQMSRPSTVASDGQGYKAMPPLIRMRSTENKTQSNGIHQQTPSQIIDEHKKMPSTIQQNVPVASEKRTNVDEHKKMPSTIQQNVPVASEKRMNVDEHKKMPSTIQQNVPVASEKRMNVDEHKKMPSTIQQNVPVALEKRMNVHHQYQANTTKEMVENSTKSCVQSAIWGKSSSKPLKEKQNKFDSDKLKIKKHVSANLNIPDFVFKARENKSANIDNIKGLSDKSHKTKADEKKRKPHNNMDYPSETSHSQTHKKPRKEPAVDGGARSLSTGVVCKTSTANCGVTQQQTTTIPQIVSEEIEGKSISCLKRPDGHIYALVEAIARVYFGSKDISEVLNVMQNILGIELVPCTDYEEQALISFYGLQTEKLHVSSLVKVHMFKQYFPVLKYMFQSKGREQKKTEPKTIQKSNKGKATIKKISIEKTVKLSQKPKQKIQSVERKKKLVVVMQDFMKSASLKKELCDMYQIKIKQ